MLGWDDVDTKFRWNLVEVGVGKGFKTVLGYTYVVEQLSFSMFPSILTFDFDLILGSFFTFWGPNGLISSWGKVQKLFWGPLM